MPLPSPKKNEKKTDFISRCMTDEIMKTEYTENDQRLTICYNQWKEDKKNMGTEIERRNIELSEFRVVEEDGQKPKLRGYAALFDRLSEPLPGFREKIAPGAFTKSIERDDIRALFNHDPNYVLGRNKAGTLILTEDEKGLSIEIDPPSTQWAHDLQESIKRKDINQMSFGFITLKDDWFNQEKKESIRTLIEVKLYDVSPVTFPAYPQTTIKVRDYIEALNEEAKAELDKQGPAVKPGADASLVKLKFRLK